MMWLLANQLGWQWDDMLWMPLVELEKFYWMTWDVLEEQRRRDEAAAARARSRSKRKR